MRSRTFLNVSLGIFALALAFHLGARSVTAQSVGTIAGFSSVSGSHCSGTFHIITESGDVYGRDMVGGLCGNSIGPLSYVGNFWAGGGPTPATQESWGSLKVRYRGAREPQGVKPSTIR
jgi:hypothetical protein